MSVSLFLYYKDSIRFYTMQAFYKLSSSFVLMQNEHSISFYHPKACRHETAEPFTSPSSDRTPTHAHTHTTGSKYTPKNLRVC